jgi:4-hydroxy-4-methyl-2-oxoglutarate aldolase
MEKAQARLDGEEAKRQKLAGGELGLDIYGMRERLAEAGLVYVDDLDKLGDFNGIDCRGR